MFSQHRGPVVVGVLVAALVAGPAWAGHSTQTVLSTGSAPGASLAAKKKASKGTLAVVVSGSGSYTVTGKGFRKTATASKSFKVKPGTYTIKSAEGSVKPRKAKVRKGKTTRVTVTFATTPAPAPSTPPPTDPVNQVPTPPITPITPTPQPTPTPPGVTGVKGPVQRVSTDAAGNQGTDDSRSPVWSPDGKKIAFDSDADNLVSGDTNAKSDVFVKTLATGVIQRISTDAADAQAEGFSSSPVWSPDGTRVAFSSSAENLVSGDTNRADDVFVKTLANGAIQRISTDAAGKQSSDNDDSRSPVWSPDGTMIAFNSDADNLVPGDTNTATDLFVKTLANGAIQRISTDAAGNQATGGDTYTYYDAAWSPDGTRIAFGSTATNLVPGDTNAERDVFVKMLASGAIQRVSTDAAGNQANDGTFEAAWSPDGTMIAFGSTATNLVPGDTNAAGDVFIKTLASGAIQRVSTDAAGNQSAGGSASSSNPAWSPDGKKILFRSWATNLVAGDNDGMWDLFVKTLENGRVELVTTDAAGNPAREGEWEAGFDGVWSPDGSRIAYSSYASNLVADDTNGKLDVFVKTLE